jgi:hypothetical protein
MLHSGLMGIFYMLHKSNTLTKNLSVVLKIDWLVTIEIVK